MQENDAVRFSWRCHVPVAAIVAIGQCISAFVQFNNSNNTSMEVKKTSVDVVKSISDLGRKVDILTIKQESSDARLLAIETESRRLAERVAQLERVR